MCRSHPTKLIGIRLAALLALLATSTVAARAEDVPPLHARIDAAIETGLIGTPAAEADDAAICRRLYLDLVGRTPSVTEARAYLADTSQEKRGGLIDALLASPEFARHFSVWLDVTLMERRADKNVPTAEWRKYLFDSVAANKPYDQLVREILSADGADPATRPAAKFYLDRDGEPFALTRDVGRMFFGMDLQCAQCHDHPLVNDYHQEDYHGLLAFLNRTALFTDAENKISLAEKAEGDTAYQSVFDPNQKGTIGPTLPGGLPLAEPTFPKGEEYLVAPADKLRSVPKHSRRSMLANVATDGKNRAFNRNIANRLWGFVFGRALVEPVDFIHTANPAAQPEVLELLADEIAARRYDLRAMLRELALTRAYSRSLELPEETPTFAANAAPLVNDCQSACKQCETSVTTAAEAAEAAREQFATAKKTEEQAATEATQAQTTLAAAEQALRDAQATMTTTQADLSAKQLLAQALSEAAAKAAEAAAQLPEDQELAAAVATVKNRGESIAANLSGLTQTMTQCQSDVSAKEAAAAAQREAVAQLSAKVETLRTQAAPLVAGWEAAISALQREQQAAAVAEQRLTWLKAMAAYRTAVDEVETRRAERGEALQKLAATAEAASAPVATAEPASADLDGARVLLASVQERLSAQEQTAEQLKAAVAAVEASQSAIAAAEGALDDAHAKLQTRWAERCLASGLTQLTPEQMAWSTWQALGVLDQQRAAAGAEWDAAHPAEGSTETPEQRAAARTLFVEQKVYDNLQGNVGVFVNLFGGAPGQPQQVFQATADQALYFANGGELRSWLAPGGGNLTERLVAQTDIASFAAELYLAVYTRQPTSEEVESLAAYLAGRDQDRAAAVQEIVWALITSSEFRFGS